MSATTKALDLRKMPAEQAARALHAWVRERAAERGQNPDSEVMLWSPDESAAKGFGRAWRVAWEAGPYDWAVCLTLGGSYLSGEVGYHDASGKGRPAEVLMVGAEHWCAEPHYGFDIGFNDY